MKKIFILPFCLLCVCVNANANEVANTNSNCGINGVSCNDTPLINYTKTDADFRAYGERAKRDHLYTKEAVGSNLTATIPPSVEEDVVTVEQLAEEIKDSQPVLQNVVKINDTIDDEDIFSTVDLDIDEDDNDETFVAGETNIAPNIKPVNNVIEDKPVEQGVFAKTESQEIEVKKEDFQKGGEVISREEKIASADTPKNEVKRTDTILISENDGSAYEVVCEEECDEILDDDNVSSEFTEESFDIADYIDEHGEEIALNDEEDIEEEIVFKNVDETKKVVAELDIKEVKITDNTILTWEANEGDNLRELLTKWSNMSGWKLLWNTNRNYVLSAGVMFKGKFADVSSALIRAFARARPAPIATYYKGNRVIVVETMENENAY